MSPEEENVLSEVLKASGIEREKLVEMVAEKELEFSGLVSRIGAIYLIGREFGCNFSEPIDSSFKINEISEGMMSFNLKANVVKIHDIREINTEKFKGRIQSIVLADSTGKITLNIWNEDIKKLDKISEGDTIDILNAYSKKNRFGTLEVTLGRKGGIKKSESKIGTETEETLLNADSADMENPFNVKLDFSCISDGDKVRVIASAVRIYKKQLVHEICPECRKKVSSGKCQNHPESKPEKLAIISCAVDDGNCVLNATFFGKQAESLSGVSALDMESKSDGGRYDQAISSFGFIGREFLVEGLIKKNSFTGDLELLVRGVKEINIEEEIKKRLC